MAFKVVSGTFKLVIWAFAAIGIGAVLLGGLIALPLQQLPELPSIAAARKTVDFSDLPGLQPFQGRDGTALAYRHYPARTAATDRVAIVVHGSSGSSGTTIHALSSALAKRGVQTYAVDIRGHGASGSRGDIGYVGQLEDDLAELVAVVRTTNPSAPLTLIGHSSGGGFALRIAGSPIQGLFARTVLLAPYLGYDAPTNQPGGGGWARADIPRIIGLVALREARHRLLRGLAGGRLRGAAEFREPGWSRATANACAAILASTPTSGPIWPRPPNLSRFLRAPMTN